MEFQMFVPYILFNVYLCGFCFFASHCWMRYGVSNPYDMAARFWGTVFSSVGWPIYFPIAATYRYFAHPPTK